MNNSRKLQLPSTKFWLIALLGLAALLLMAQQTLAQDDAPAEPTPTGPPLHPNFALLDAEGNNVLDSGEPVSTMNSCGVCHDAEFIAGHSSHVDAGLSEMSAPGETGNGRSWDISTGTFGKWSRPIPEMRIGVVRSTPSVVRTVQRALLASHVQRSTSAPKRTLSRTPKRSATPWR